jgi:hypothetical protein
MIDRRQVLIRGGGALAAINFGIAARAATAAKSLVRAPALLLVDTALFGNEPVIEAARREGIPVARFASDFGTAWLEHLEPLWRQSPSPIAGLTSAGSFFCAEHLARGCSLVCSFKSSGNGLGDSSLLWALGPRDADIMGWIQA